MPATLDILIANEPGKSISVPYKDDEAIFFLLQRISSKLGENVDKIMNHYLYINGVRLEDERQSIGNYRVFGNGLTYLALVDPRLSGPTLIVRTFTGKSRFLAYDPDATISDLKKSIQTLERIPPDQQRLIFDGRQLEDERTLENYNITNGSVLYMIMRLCGGGILPGVMFTDVSDISGIRKYEFSTSAPPGRVASPGANVECKCDCTKGYRVICRKGFGTIELSKEQFICPNCNQSNRITPVTIGFSKCKYRFHGIKASGQQYTSDWKVVKPEDCYQLFNPSNQTTWKRLVIESADFGHCEDCTICLEPLYNINALECGHRFHSSCYSKWNSSCPNCRFNQHLITGRSSNMM